MPDFVAVRVVERLAHGGSDSRGSARVDRAGLAVLDRPASTEFHDYVVTLDPVFAGIRPGVVNGDDIRVGQPGGGERLPPEPGEELLVVRQVGVKDFDRNRPGE